MDPILWLVLAIPIVSAIIDKVFVIKVKGFILDLIVKVADIGCYVVNVNVKSMRISYNAIIEQLG